jgi:hypothetical protein
MSIVNILKITSVILFLLLPIPNEKFVVINGALLVLSLVSLFQKEYFTFTNIVFALSGLLGLACVLFNKKRYIVVGYVLTWIYLAPQLIPERLLSYTLFLMGVLLYFILSVTVIILSYRNKYTKPAN